MIAKTTLLTTLGLALCAFTACGPPAIRKSLEVTALRYDTTYLTDCGGDVRNISTHTISDLQVKVEFQNADGNRVRMGMGEVSPPGLAPGSIGRFSVLYLKGSNDPPVVRCRVLEFNSGGVLLLHDDETAALNEVLKTTDE